MADPLYRRVADDLCQEIWSGYLVPGNQLPSEDTLIDRFDASRDTIRDAIKFLISLGLVEVRPRQGTFVVEPLDPLVTTLTVDRVTGLGGGEEAAYLSEARDQYPRSTVPTVAFELASGEIAARLMVPEGTRLVSRHEQRFIRSKRANQPVTLEVEERPWSIQTSFYPRRFALMGAERLLDNEDIEQGTVKYLDETLGLKQVGYRDWITVRIPNTDEIAFFELPLDSRICVYEIFRTSFDQTGAPMRVTVTIFPADRNQFIIDVGDVPPNQARFNQGVTNKSSH